MKIGFPSRRGLSALAVFGLAGAGLYVALPADSGTAGSDLVPVIVVNKEFAEGTSTELVRGSVSVRMVPEVARAASALTAIGQIPKGVLAYVHVGGQQLLQTSFAEDHVSSLGNDYVALSISLDTARWAGPILQSGRRVDVWDTNEAGPELVADGAVVLDAPSPVGIKPDVDTVVSIGVRRESVEKVLLAVANKRVWLVSK